MCTSLQYTDLNGSPYYGRTLELEVDEPWILVYVPPKTPFESKGPDTKPVSYVGKYGFIAVTAPNRMPTEEEPLTANDLKVIEGMNTEGVTFSLLAYASTGVEHETAQRTMAALEAWDAGSWVLSQAASVGEVKTELAEHPDSVHLPRVKLIGDAVFPFHLVIHDKTGASIVVEWHRGELHVYDNPVGVMTNGPEFPWHMTNLGNYTHLTNIDHSAATFNGVAVRQPDSGIATAGLPSSDTAVDRFVRAVFYTNFVEKVKDPDKALLNLSRIMNKFDRARGVSVIPGKPGGGKGTYQGIESGDSDIQTEYTVWTDMADLERKLFYFRSYDQFNWSSFDLDVISKSADGVRVVMTHKLSPNGGDATQELLAGVMH
ncbi:linear amide C-N hydrolase [Propionibacterium sp.]|uniref:linear amide C-N hydrolase n=1 Tax=Propionibacterium sp. TaxID=1977903 RepID=UPI0039E876F7